MYQDCELDRYFYYHSVDDKTKFRKKNKKYKWREKKVIYMWNNNRWNHLAGHNILAAPIDLSLFLAPVHTHLSHGHTCIITRKESIEGLKIGLSIFSFAWFIRLDCGCRTFFFSSFLCIFYYLMLIFVCFCCSMFNSCCSLYALFLFDFVYCYNSCTWTTDL